MDSGLRTPRDSVCHIGFEYNLHRGNVKETRKMPGVPKSEYFNRKEMYLLFNSGNAHKT